jgi:hypothetical protein
MNDYIKVAILENDDEARLIASILKEREIPHFIRSYFDTAFNGLYQSQKGWGYVSAPEDCTEEILDILTDIRNAATEWG